MIASMLLIAEIVRDGRNSRPVVKASANCPKKMPGQTLRPIRMMAASAIPSATKKTGVIMKCDTVIRKLIWPKIKYKAANIST